MKHYEFELGRAADILTRDLLKLKSGETFVITGDSFQIDSNRLHTVRNLEDTLAQILWVQTMKILR